MKLFECQSCRNALYFENTQCERCGHKTGYLPARDTMSAVEPDGANWIALAQPQESYRFCANWERSACNWMVRADSESRFCRACQHNRTIPDLSDPAHLGLWQRIEHAKRRLMYSLILLGLPTPTLATSDNEPLIFDFLADQPQKKILTGHDEGVITISLMEADDATREKRRSSLNEPYRTLLGHFRHEVGHYYWNKLVRDRGRLDSFRAVFGDERPDYGEALQRYYANGPLANWQESYVSAYATMHPWEDFAETWAHYLHIVDTLETAYAFHLSTTPSIEDVPSATVDRNPYKARDVATLMQSWLPLTFAVNSLNRSMGQPDLYPFVIATPAMAKLQYVHEIVHAPDTEAAEPADAHAAAVVE